MTFNYPKSGLNNVAEYQASGLPWVSSSAVGSTPIQIDFPYVTNWIHIKQTSAAGNLRFGWTVNGINGVGTQNYGTLASSGSFEGHLRMRSLFLRSDTTVSASFEVIAGLTMIDFNQFPILTASAVYPNSGTYGTFGYGIQNSTPWVSGVGLG